MDAISRLRILHYASCRFLFDRLLESLLKRFLALAPSRLPKNSKHCSFLCAETFYMRCTGSVHIECSRRVLIKDGRMNVTLPAYRNRIAELLCDGLNSGDDVFLGLSRGMESMELT